MKVVVFFADGTEEVEALTALDVLRRAGAETVLAGVGTLTPTGSHGIRVFADKTAEDIASTDFDMAVLPGGMPGAKNLDASAAVEKIVCRVHARGGYLAAICAAPLVLGKRGYLRGKHAVCYPGFETYLEGAILEKTAVCHDGRLITAAGPGAAMAFALMLAEVLFGEEKAAALRASLLA